MTSLAARLVQGDRAALAKAITWLESTRPAHRNAVAQVINELPLDRDTFRVGLTGAPGVGKSTFIDALGRHVLAQRADTRLAVLAVDPSSTRSGGSLLGDRTRMPRLVNHPRAYIRPSPSCGTLGGVTRTTHDALRLCAAAGYDTSFIETVGVGQSETVVASLCDCFLLLLSPGSGDELQGMKRGIMEWADIIVITKADDDLLAPAKRVAMEVTSALKFLPLRHPGWRPRVLTVSAQTANDWDDANSAVMTSSGIAAVWDSVCEFRSVLTCSGELAQARARQRVAAMWRTVKDSVLDTLLADAEVKRVAETLETQVRRQQMSPHIAADTLMHAFFASRAMATTMATPLEDADDGQH